ncbi:hypothetical protein [Rhodococcus qingshengii]|uniref:hypothetical protein n=1 Tax=Rhodococcus qingshengii TaxID=334542 RepID=UPI001A41E1F9|nr:hypothetical protein [Rhodococcus qingshengii]ULD38929.1 hypothetical protein JKI97_01125 [Rhodococcus qingshengii]
MDDMMFDDAAAYTTTITTRNVWVFDSTDGAYNTTQTDDDIRDGDILLVPSENVAGFLNKAWPTAVTEDAGAFHHFPAGIPDDLQESAATAAKVWDEYRSRHSS